MSLLAEAHRSIIHVDLDAFFCSVEELLDPSIRGLPIIVGADPRGRGVVAAASYAVRRYGVHSAMPIGRAARLCPHAIFLRPRHEVYGEYSRKVMVLLGGYTPLVEQISIDEAFLDVTGSRELFGSAEDIGHTIQRRVQEELGLPCTVGIAANKLAAKVASDLGKPRGFVVVPPGQEAAFLAPLDVGRLWGVGPKTAQRLQAQGVRTIGDLAAIPVERLRSQFGRMGEYLHIRAHSIDDSPVEPSRPRKSISQNHTFERDTADPARVEAKLLELSENVAALLRREGWRARTVTLTLRYADFTTITRSQTLTQPADLAEVIYDTGLHLLRREWRGERTVRLVGIGASNLVPAAEVQPSLFDLQGDRRDGLARAVDRLRERFGEDALRRAKTMR
jgi:DNA polymerase-4